MSALDILLWGVLPYVVVAVLVGGTIWRWRYDQFGWTTRSSQLYESRLLRWGSPLFHFGILVVLIGHLIGLVLADGELPDHLPVVLEFAAVGDQEAGLGVLQEHRAGLELLRLALTDLRSPYAGPVAAVCALLPGPSPADEAAARALARGGPPVEHVGLEPYAMPTGGPR